MTDVILINAGLLEMRVAYISGGNLIEIWHAPLHEPSLVDAIYLGRVARLEPGFDAAFVDIGNGNTGFLPLKGGRVRQAGAEPAPVVEGQTVLVQVTKDAISGKALRLSTRISLSGRLLVYTPSHSQIRFSRRIGQGALRDRLKSQLEGLPGSGGWTVRTAAQSAAAAEIAHEHQMLQQDWENLQKDAGRRTAPSCLQPPPSPVIRAVRDYATSATAEIVIDDAAHFAAAEAYCRAYAPDIAARLQHHRGTQPLFDRFETEAQIAAALEPRVPLPAGGWLSIETTEALTAVDINAGQATASRNAPATARLINREAAEIFAAQARLRGLGGLIVLDFLQMNGAGEVKDLCAHLRRSFADDPAEIRIGDMSSFGLIEMTRERRHSNLASHLGDLCASCHGHGRTPTVSATANALIRRLEREAATGKKHGHAHLVASPQLHAFLCQKPDPIHGQLENRLGRRIELRCDQTLESHIFTLHWL